jgi:hypothetical protein
MVSLPTTHRTVGRSHRDKPAFYELVDFINKNLPREEANKLKLAFVKVSPPSSSIASVSGVGSATATELTAWLF